MINYDMCFYPAGSMGGMGQGNQVQAGYGNQGMTPNQPQGMGNQANYNRPMGPQQGKHHVSLKK